MKKIILFSVLSVLAVASCAKFEQDPEFQKVVTGAPVISKTDSTETTISAIITPADTKTAYYAYAVIAGGVSKKISASTLISNGYKDAAVVSASVSAKDVDTVKVAAEKLKKGATYTLYAVAASTNGVLSEISTHMFILDDKAAPAFDAASVTAELAEDSTLVVSIPFDRNLKLGQNATVKMTAWGRNDVGNIYTYKGYDLIISPVWEDDITGDAVSVDGNNLVVTVDKKYYTSGMDVTFSFAAGTVISLPVSVGGHADVPCEECAAQTYIYYQDGPEDETICYQYPNYELTFAADTLNNPTFVVDVLWEDAKFAVASIDSIVTTKIDTITVTYVDNTTSHPTQKVVCLAAADATYSAGKDTIIFSLPVAPKVGEEISITIPAGACADIYGNESTEVTIEDIPVGKLEFELQTALSNCNYLREYAIPAIKGVYFFADYVECSGADTTDAGLVKDTKDYIQYVADNLSKTFAETYVGQFANVDTAYVGSVNLTAETDYMVYAFYMQADGTVISPVFKKVVTTPKFEIPSETTGTFDATLFFEQTWPGLPVEFNATKDTLTISNWGHAGDKTMQCVVDASGNVSIIPFVAYVHPSVGNIYYFDYSYYINQKYGFDPGIKGYYDQNDKTIYFASLYWYSGGIAAASEEIFADTFCFDNSSPAPTTAAARKFEKKIVAKDIKPFEYNSRHIAR